MSLVSIIIPCYNEEPVIQETKTRLDAFTMKHSDYDFELIFVDDGSRDGTCHLLSVMAQTDHRVKIIRLARNFGHQVAITAGIDMANGEGVVVIDTDLQDPPELIAAMISKWREGFDVVYAQRVERRGESRFKIATANLFYKLINYLSDIPIPQNVGDFRFMSRRAVDALKAMPERDRFVRGMVSWIGFKQTSIQFVREKRFAGETKYPLRKMLRFAADGVLSFSIKPLQFSVIFAGCGSFAAILIMIYAIVLRLFSNTWVPGWAAIIVAILFLGSVQLICIGVLGEYIGRIYMESKRRPLYIISDYIGKDAIAPSDSPERTEQTA